MATITFSNGVIANLYATTAHGGRDEIDVFLRTKHRTVRLTATDLFVDGERMELDTSGTCGTKPCYGMGHSILIPAFYRAIREGAPVPVSAEAATASLSILLGIYQSNGETVRLANG